MRYLKFMTFVLFICLVSLSGCKKSGCNDIYADNYDVEADYYEPNSCYYSIGIGVWWDESTTQYLLKHGVTALSIYVDGKFIDSKAASTYWRSVPTFSNSIHYTKSLGTINQGTVHVEVYDQSGNLGWDFTRAITASTGQVVIQLTAGN